MMPMMPKMVSKKQIKGKHTLKSSGHCKYGGWNPNRIVRFNELKRLVAEDRVSPQTETIEGIAGILQAEIWQEERWRPWRGYTRKQHCSV
jgi:hypothetical protein